MKTPLTAERVRELLHYDTDTGVFTWRVPNKYRRHLLPGNAAGMLNKSGYLRLKIDNVSHLGHRVAWLYVRGYWPTKFIDHINGVRSDNRFANLREATRSENRRNCSRRTDNSSGVTGVYLDRRSGKWIAVGGVNNAAYKLGMFSTFEAAVAARQSFTSMCWGDFAPNLARRISDRIAPLTITAEGLAALGFPEPSEADFPRMLDSMIAHLRMLQQQKREAA